MSLNHRFYQVHEHPPGINVADARVVDLSRPSCARLTRSLPLSGSDIECCIAANASSTRVKRLRNITTQRQNREAVATGSIVGCHSTIVFTKSMSTRQE